MKNEALVDWTRTALVERAFSYHSVTSAMQGCSFLALIRALAHQPSTRIDMDARDGLKSGLLENLPDFRYGSTMAVCARPEIVLLCPQQRAWTPRRKDAKKVLADLPRDLRKAHGAKKAVAADRHNIEMTDERRNRRAIDIGVKTIENRRPSDHQQDL